MVQIEIRGRPSSSKGKTSINKPDDRKISSKVGSRGWACYSVFRGFFRHVFTLIMKERALLKYGAHKIHNNNKNWPLHTKSFIHYLNHFPFIIFLWSWGSCHFHFRKVKPWLREVILLQVTELVRGVEFKNCDCDSYSFPLCSNVLQHGTLLDTHRCPEMWLIHVSLKKNTRSLT